MQIEQSTLDNGLRVVSARLPGFRSAAVAVFVRAGSRNEQASNSGIAHFLEHMAFKGTATRSALQIASEIEVLGAHINAYTSEDTTAYYVTGLGSTVAASVAILGDVLTASVYDQKEVATERGVILQEIKGYADDPMSVASDGFGLTAYPDQSAGRPIIGSAEVVANATREDMVAFIRENYAARNMIAVATGDVEHAEFVDLVAKHFAALPADAPLPRPEPARYVGGQHRNAERDFEQVNILLGLQSVPETDPEAQAHRLLGSALGGGMSSPLFQEIREKRGLVYMVHGFAHNQSDHGELAVMAGTTAEHLEDFLKIACEQLAKAADEIAESDLMRARNARLVGLATAREQPFRVAQKLAHGLFTRGRIVTPEEEMREVEAVTPEQVKAAARSAIRSNPTVSLVGPVPERDYHGMVRQALGRNA
ncbi:insulinase family protein [Roseomonas sp. NAR14]|uniref:Insulinase family protein n=1 Tax=Roseomonas acroporae TaxID=2937791 RepID=A0A9X1Y6U5_9PROT|nr:pitrilysin family protein [Roseomonas acroporae]MCK8784581.1 insulinase family protein [Roseomonas acroporae]